jgi:hypothetical protein
MQCPDCNSSVATFDVPIEFRDHLPTPVDQAGLCTSCLALHPAEEGGEPEFGFDVFPDEPDSAIAMAVGVGLLDSLALNRDTIETLFREVAASGTDPFLVLETLAASGAVQPQIDIEARQQQLEQLMG